METKNGQQAKPKHLSRIDGGYGWMIVFGSFINHFLLFGFVGSFGIIYVTLLRIFDSSGAQIAGVPACFNSLRMLLGE